MVSRMEIMPMNNRNPIPDERPVKRPFAGGAMRIRSLGIGLMLALLTGELGYAQSAPAETNRRVYMPIPGNDKMNTEDIIQKLLMVKRIPIQSKERDNQDYRIENDIIKDFSRYLRDLDARSKALFDYQTPFREMVGNSSDASILEVSAGRRAKKGSYRFTVLQTAKPDSFKSQSVGRSRVFSSSDFTITIGENSYHVRFPGGTIYQLAQAIQEQTEGKVEVKTVGDTPSTAILVISGTQTGEKMRMGFQGNVAALLESGILVNGREQSVNLPLPFDTLSPAPELLPDGVKASPGYQGALELGQKALEVNERTTFIFQARMMTNALPRQEDAAILTNGPDIQAVEPVKVSNITVEGGSLISFFEEVKEAPPQTSNFTEILTLRFDDGSVKTYFVEGSGFFSNSLDTYRGKKLVGMSIRNLNTDRTYEITQARVVKSLTEGGLQPANVISRACDAILNMDGVEIRRDKNQIEDLLEGVTVTAKMESTAPVSADVDHDYQRVEDAVLAWVDSYNKAMEYLYILTQTTKDRTRLSERPAQTLKDGIFQTETSFSSLRNKLRTVSMEAYATVYGRELALLEQIGLYTKKTGSFSSSGEEWNQAKMGLLTIEQEKLKNALRTRFDGVEQLFANDTDGDLVKDSGVAVSASASLRLAIGAGSFIERRISYNENKIQQNNKEIEEMNRQLLDYETTLRRKYGEMNRAIRNSESQQKWLNNQFRSGQ